VHGQVALGRPQPPPHVVAYRITACRLALTASTKKYCASTC
jgi:hypothetical protein